MNLTPQKLTVYTSAVLIVLIVGIIVYVQVFQGQPTTTAPSGELVLDDQPAIGDPNAPVKIAIFEDFKCPACRTFEENVMPRVMRNFVDTGQAQVYFVNFQFLAPDSITAGIASECAYAQSETAFWNYKTYIYRSQGPQSQTWATPERLTEIAREFVPELDADELQTCIEERRYEDAVMADRELGERVGVTGTPSVYVNGRRLESGVYELIDQAVSRAIAQSQ